MQDFSSCSNIEIDQRPGRLRFSTYDELILLQDVVRQNPYEDRSRWNIIHENVVQATGKPFSLRSLRDHVEHMIKLLKREDKALMKKPNITEEELEEIIRLIQDIVELSRQHGIQKINKNRKHDHSLRNSAVGLYKKSFNSAEETDHEYCIIDNIDTIIHCEDISFSTNNDKKVRNDKEPLKLKRKFSDSSNSKEINFKDNETRYKELELEERRLKIEEKKLELEERKLSLEENKLAYEERKLRLEERKFEIERKEKDPIIQIDMKEENTTDKIVEQQRLLIELLRKNINK